MAILWPFLAIRATLMAPTLMPHEYLLPPMIWAEFYHFRISGSIVCWQLLHSFTDVMKGASPFITILQFYNSLWYYFNLLQMMSQNYGKYHEDIKINTCECLHKYFWKFQYYIGGSFKFITILHRGGLPNLLQYYIGGEGSLGTPKIDYVICARPLAHMSRFLWHSPQKCRI